MRTSVIASLGLSLALLVSSAALARDNSQVDLEDCIGYCYNYYPHDDNAANQCIIHCIMTHDDAETAEPNVTGPPARPKFLDGITNAVPVGPKTTFGGPSIRPRLDPFQPG